MKAKGDYQESQGNLQEQKSRWEGIMGVCAKNLSHDTHA